MLLCFRSLLITVTMLLMFVVVFCSETAHGQPQGQRFFEHSRGAASSLKAQCGKSILTTNQTIVFKIGMSIRITFTYS